MGGRARAESVDRLCIGAGNVVMGVLSIDTRGGGSGFADGMMGTVNKASGAGTTPILATAFSVGKWKHETHISMLLIFGPGVTLLIRVRKVGEGKG